jgi:hypothetical protein
MNGWRVSEFRASHSHILLGATAGLAGGIAEVVWVGLYSAITGSNGFDIARHVAGTLAPVMLQAPYAVAVGLAIHFNLSILLGIALVRPLMAIVRSRSAALEPISLGLLGLIWAVNFLFVLPILNPAFPLLLPTWVSLASKLLFAAALAAVLRLGTRAPKPATSKPFDQQGWLPAP